MAPCSCPEVTLVDRRVVSPVLGSQHLQSRALSRAEIFEEPLQPLAHVDVTPQTSQICNAPPIDVHEQQLFLQLRSVATPFLGLPAGS